MLNMANSGREHKPAARGGAVEGGGLAPSGPDCGNALPAKWITGRAQAQWARRRSMKRLRSAVENFSLRRSSRRGRPCERCARMHRQRRVRRSMMLVATADDDAVRDCRSVENSVEILLLRPSAALIAGDVMCVRVLPHDWG